MIFLLYLCGKIFKHETLYFYPPPHSFCRHVAYLLIALAVCGCKNDSEPLSPLSVSSVASPAPAVNADTLISVLEDVGSWRVVAINKREGCFLFDLSTDGTMANFADGEVTFAVPYTSISFDTDNEPTTEYEQYGPYSVSCSQDRLIIADEAFVVSYTANGGYSLKSEKIEIELEK